MKKLHKLSVFSLSVAIFAMFFGAGNIVFPLIIGKEVGSAIGVGLLGFIITAVLVPLLGFIAMILYEGDYDKFFFTLGKVPAVILIGLLMIIIGPFAASRCVIISYAAIQEYIPFSLLIYTIIIAGVVFVLAMRENKVIPILGRFLGPIKISLLSLIIILVLIFFKKIPTTDVSLSYGFFKGLREGYFTLDLIGAFFFSHLIYQAMEDKTQGQMSLKQLISKGIIAGLLGGLFLAIIYSGFGLAAAIHGQEMVGVPDEQLFSAVAHKILNANGSLLANTTVSIATLTTSIALTTVFADYLFNEIFRKKIAYVYVLAIALIINIFVENLKFSGVMKILAPTAILLYPAFIVLCIANICHKLYGFKYIKAVVVLTFILSVLFQYAI